MLWLFLFWHAGCDIAGMKHSTKSIVLAGAAPDTGNHGVTALCHSAVLGLQERGIEKFTIFDHGAGLGPAGDGSVIGSADTRGLAFKAGKRVYQGANMHHARLKQLMGLGSPALNAMHAADAVVDVSGGDSFTDLYGQARFDQVTLPKLMALDAGVPLILLPQTYGPFRSERSRRIAKHILKNCTLAFARDINSLNQLKTLLVADYDEQKHRLGVDLAFGLPTETQRAPAEFEVAGINVSGLLWNNPDEARERFSLKADYKASLSRLCRYILSASDLDILLVPHVTPLGGSESDLVASRSLKEMLPTDLQARIRIEETAQTPAALKGVIANTSWFAGARMHATIAALSSSVPVANMAYSRKALGVFDCCGAASHVYDMRKLSTFDLTQNLIEDFECRHQHKKLLGSQIPFVLRRWGYQMDAISSTIKHLAGQKELAYA